MTPSDQAFIPGDFQTHKLHLVALCIWFKLGWGKSRKSHKSRVIVLVHDFDFENKSCEIQCARFARVLLIIFYFFKNVLTHECNFLNGSLNINKFMVARESLTGHQKLNQFSIDHSNIDK